MERHSAYLARSSVSLPASSAHSWPAGLDDSSFERWTAASALPGGRTTQPLLSEHTDWPTRKVLRAKCEVDCEEREAPNLPSDTFRVAAKTGVALLRLS